MLGSAVADATAKCMKVSDKNDRKIGKLIALASHARRAVYGTYGTGDGLNRPKARIDA